MSKAFISSNLWLSHGTKGGQKERQGIRKLCSKTRRDTMEESFPCGLIPADLTPSRTRNSLSKSNQPVSQSENIPREASGVSLFRFIHSAGLVMIK
jgi:hypothetical protein